MANETIGCPSPFENLLDFPYKGGLEASRFCSPLTATLTCCLPCPLTEWVYSDNFNTVATAANWVSVGSVACCAFLLLSFSFLPIQKTSRHYLTVCLVSAIAILSTSFVIPLGAKPDQCHDKITPNDMRSNTACAISGAFVMFGGISADMWVFMRSLSLHLQICWQIVPGRKFFFTALLVGWGIPATILAIALPLTGVSYRFGNICHINHEKGLGTFWIPLLAFAGIAGILQFLTLGYCIRVYLRSVMDSGSGTSTTATSSNLPSVAPGSIRTVSPKAAYRRIRKVIALQWRGIAVIVILIGAVVYFAVIFITLDSMTASELKKPAKAMPWLTCLIEHGGDKNKCLSLASTLILSESKVMAVLFVIAAMGFWCAIFLGRLSMVTGWLDMLPLTKSSDFISVDARRVSRRKSMSDPRNYEMLTSPPQQFFMAKTPEGSLAAKNALDRDRPITRDFSPPPPEFTPPTQHERSPSLNFSHPRPLDRVASHSGRVTFSREDPTSRSPEWPSSAPPGRTNSTPSNSLPGFARPQPLRQASVPTTMGGGERRSSALGRDWSAGPGLIGSPTPYRSGSSLSQTRDWDPRSTYARGSGPLTPGGGESSAEKGE